MPGRIHKIKRVRENAEDITKGRKTGWIILSVILLFCLGLGIFLYWPRTGGAVAVITVDGREYRRIDLRKAADETFSIQGDTGKPVSFEIKDHKIRFVQVTCPDHICERAGFCKAPGERAVCLPNRTALVCYSAGEV